MERGHLGNSLFSFGDHSCEKNRRHNAACYWVGFPFSCHRKYIERKLSRRECTALHVYVIEEEWEFVYRVDNNGKKSETECAIILRGLSLEFEVCERNVRSRSRLHPRIAISEASILIEFTIDSARNWWLNHL